MKRDKSKKAEATVPLQVRLGLETRGKLKAIADQNGLSLNDIATMCLAAGMARVAAKLGELREPKKEAA